MIHKAKKSLGQNFLKSSLALKKIVEAGEITSKDIILEIGPGKGALTSKLLEKVHPAHSGAGQGTVIAVEKDNMLLDFLKIKFAKQIKLGSLVLVHDDILDFNVKQNILERTFAQRGGASKAIFQQKNMRGESENVLRNYKIIANIPYNITGAILKKFLTEKNQPERMILMVQHEVAKRILARDKKESILSISVKAYGEPALVMKVPARYFSPAPKVDSAVIAITNISRKLFTLPPLPSAPPPSKGGGKMEVQDKTLNSLEFEEKFWEIVKKGFAHKRKKLSGNLKNTDLAKKDVLADLGDKRAENLSLLDWINLSK